jgi:hypothetical protein
MLSVDNYNNYFSSSSIINIPSIRRIYTINNIILNSDYNNNPPLKVNNDINSENPHNYDDYSENP